MANGFGDDINDFEDDPFYIYYNVLNVSEGILNDGNIRRVTESNVQDKIKIFVVCNFIGIRCLFGVCSIRHSNYMNKQDRHINRRVYL